MTRVKNVRDTIYLLLFSDPNYAFEISKIIYGKENKVVFRELKQMLDKGLIDSYSVETSKFKDGRSQQRNYYHAEVDLILTYIKKTVGKEILFDSFSKSIIESILQSQAFRYLIKKNLPKDFKERSINAFDFILTYLDILFIISSQNTYFASFSKDIHRVGDYENALENLQKDPLFNNKLQEVSELLFHEGEKNITPDVKEHLAYLFIIPEKIVFGHPGFSSFGIKYFDIISKARDFSNLFESSKIKKI